MGFNSAFKGLITNIVIFKIIVVYRRTVIVLNLTVAFRSFAKAVRNCLNPVAAGPYKILKNFQGYDYISTSLRASSDRIKNSVTVYTDRLENSPDSLSTYTRKYKTL